MTTYNTQNPLGSTDPRDLYDNSQVFDELVNNTTDPTVQDRFGNTRITLANQLGYNFKGDYAAGIELISYTDIIRYNSEFYRPSASATLPYTTTATLPDVDSNLVPVGDANLRQELALPSATAGSDLISHTGTPDTVTQALDKRTVFVGSVADAVALSPAHGQNIKTLGYYAAGDGGGADYFAQTPAAFGATPDELGDHTAANGNILTLQTKGFVIPEQCGAVGDGVAGDIASYLSARDHASWVINYYGKIYLLTESVSMSDGQAIDLNGSEMRFAVVGQKRCLQVNDGGRVYNGTVTNTVGSTGFPGDYQTPVVVGTFTDGNRRENVVVRDLVVENAMPNGNGVVVFGDTSNFEIKNIVFPQSSTLGRAVMLHWSFLEATPVADTFHVHSGVVENIKSRGMNISGAADAATVFLSAVYDVTVRNVYCLDLEQGDIVRVYAGDYGFQYAQTTDEADLAGQGIKIHGVYGKAEKALQVSMLNPSGGISKVWPTSVKASGIGAKGYGSTNSLSNGVDVQACLDFELTSSELSEFYSNVFVGGSAENVKINGNRLLKGYAKGIDCRFDAKTLRIKDNEFQDNNSSGLTGQDVFLAVCDDIILSGNTYNSPLATHNVRCDTGANAPSRVRILDDTSEDVSAAGPAFSIGGSGDFDICTLFSGNQCLNVPSNGIVSGQLFIPYVRSSGRASNVENVRCLQTTFPAAGSWNQGDRIDHEQPVVDANDMILDGWDCTASGSPGTWQPRYVSTVSPAV